MLFFVIETKNLETGGWSDALWLNGYRPFKAATAEEAAKRFEAAVPEHDRDTHRFRRVEYGEFLNRGGI